MPKANAGLGPMSLVKWTLIGLLVLPAAELFAFFLVAALIGWLWAAALFITPPSWACCCSEGSDAPISTACAPPSLGTGFERCIWKRPAWQRWSAESF